MKTWREEKIGKGIKRPNSKQMIGLDQKKILTNKIKKEKEKQRKLLKEIRDEIKKIEQLGISLDGLEKISNSSIRSIQARREKSIITTNKSIKELTLLTNSLKKLEIQLNTTVSKK